MPKVASLLIEARTGRGLTQRELAALAHVPQSTVARIEAATLSPRVETLEKLLAQLDVELSLRPVYGRGVDRSLIRRMLRLTPTERVEYSVAGATAIRELQNGVRRQRDEF